MTSFFQAFFSLVRLIPCTLLIVSPYQPFRWFNLYTACLWISSLIVWKFLFFIKRWKRNISFVTFFVLDWSQPLGCVSVVFVFVAWCPDFVSFLSDQHVICTDHYNVSATSGSERFLALLLRRKRVEKLLQHKLFVANGTSTFKVAFANCGEALSCMHQKVSNCIEWKFI